MPGCLCENGWLRLCSALSLSDGEICSRVCTCDAAPDVCLSQKHECHASSMCKGKDPDSPVHATDLTSSSLPQDVLKASRSDCFTSQLHTFCPRYPNLPWWLLTRHCTPLVTPCKCRPVDRTHHYSAFFVAWPSWRAIQRRVPLSAVHGMS